MKIKLSFAKRTIQFFRAFKFKNFCLIPLQEYFFVLLFGLGRLVEGLGLPLKLLQQLPLHARLAPLDAGLLDL